MHQISGHWKLGFILALCTALLWGLLPIALKKLLVQMDAYTVTWYRFFASAVCLLLFQLLIARVRPFPSFNPFKPGLLLIAILGMTSNYILYLIGLDYSDSNTTQVVIQLAPMLLFLGGLVIFKESCNWVQWLGVVLFLIGISLFFHRLIMDIHNSDREYLFGVFLVAFAALTWAFFALAQKQLLSSFSSSQIMLCIYWSGAMIFLPFTSLNTTFNLDMTGIALLAFCCANTLFAYGFFAKSLNHLEASRVSAILAITPVLTILFNYTFYQWDQTIFDIHSITILNISGAILMVIGGMVTALGKLHRSIT